MTTGSFDNFAGAINEIGPLYPFAGSEMILVVIGVVCWIAWHVSEMRIEQREYDDEIASGAVDREPD